MPHEGYDDLVTNDGPRFHSNMPVSELTERVTRAIEEGNVSSAPPVVRNHGRGNAQNSTEPYQSPIGLRGSRHLNHLNYARCQDPRLCLAQSLKMPWLRPNARIRDSVSPDPKNYLSYAPMPGSVSSILPDP